VGPEQCVLPQEHLGPCRLPDGRTTLSEAASILAYGAPSDAVEQGGIYDPGRTEDDRRLCVDCQRRLPHGTPYHVHVCPDGCEGMFAGPTEAERAESDKQLALFAKRSAPLTEMPIPRGSGRRY
jgi:hypothetical protein